MKFLAVLSREFEEHWVRADLRAVVERFGTYERFPVAPGTPTDPAALTAALAAADVAFSGWPTPLLPVALLERPRQLRYICHLTGTIRHCIPKAYLEAGITVTNWGDGPMWYLAEGNMMLILALTREVQRLPRHMRERPQWTYPYAMPSPTLRRKTVGFVGYGAVARMLVELMRPFDVKVLAFDPFLEEWPAGIERAATMDDVFARADVVSIQCGLTDQTRGMIGAAQFKLLKPNAIFINTARGKIVREAEMAAFLRERRDVLAGLDVFEQEPLPTDSPLLGLDNVICYPHSVGGGGEACECDGSAYAARNVEAFCTGAPLKAVLTARKYDLIT